MPPPLRKPSLGPQGQRTLRRSSSPAPPSSRSRSPSTSSNNSDNDFVYVLGHVKSTEEAVECIRAVQQPKEKHQGRSLGGLGSSAKSLTELVTTSENRYPASRKMKGELPATMEEFYESPRYTVSLTAARGALFSDALSGFHSYVACEEEQCDQLCTYATQGGAVRTSAVPSPSPAMTQEWNTTLAASSALPAKPASMAVKATGVVEEGHAQVATPASALPPNQRTESAGAPSTAADPSIPSPSAVPGPAHTFLQTKAAFPPSIVAAEAVTAAVAEGTESGSPRVPASYMFLVRSRDSEVMNPGSSSAPAATPHSVALESPVFPSSRDSRASGRTTIFSEPTPGSATNLHVDAAGPAAAVGKGAKPVPAPLTPAQETERAAKLEAMQPHVLLQKANHYRESVPVVFRYRYSPDFEETIDENKKRQQQLDRALRKHHWLAGSSGLTHAERQEISRRFADPNALAHEWLYVWEQFERDIPRETLLVEDTPYHDANIALAAILSYVEYSYDRSQQHMKKLAAALAAEQKGDAATTPAATAAASLGAGNSSSGPASRRKTTLLEHFFSAGTAALKGAVVKMRASLPDFVGDPLLSVSGYNPALYHASLLFPTDPKARSEKIFSAVREVVLASQQSFMGFPYQLLCEQVGMERLGLALEALERDEAEVGDLDEETEAEKTARVTPVDATHEEGKLQTSGSGATASIPLKKTAEAEPAVKEITTSMHSSLHGSRVLRIYHSFPSSTSVTNRSGNDHRHRQHTVHAVDEWNVSSSSSRSSDAAPSSLSLNISPATTAPLPPPGASVESTEEKEQPAAVLDVLPAHCLSEEARRRKETVARLRRERRRRRPKQLPLLVGEPRLHEFAAFLDILRSRLIAKQVKEERKEMEQRQRERVQQAVKRQCEQWGSAPASRQGSHPGSRQAPSASRDMMKQAEDPLAPTAQPADTAMAPRKLFHEDVDGSAYLIPTRSASATMEPPSRSPRSLLSSTSMREVSVSPEMHGMRIRLFFDDKRNVPVVVVNKLFRLFTMPGLRGFTSSDDDITEALNDKTAAKAATAHPSASARKSGAGRTGSSEKSLLLLIQVQFSLFLQEDAEVRWKWWKL
ncbi:hypothetical protein LMJF_34_0660 [Leishmania major strain Friedlin]|uniref:Uncharacterized protein n=1 Tax=Leishmania major TaxID=5664 RepID=Q4Q3E1_LEIMA|nr:hypothetical protein LMJF_34_0660 [Leishmania major strain Friedlin]CAG9581840.1 hypothetical_protein_-_conserved [Leishmania major strain Friedlin]CAJ07771.1 hypothetical protein LMJF_34_0660 [Leishmania major strain Friedlin]|eukprot:XP_001686157.1 hypothetical protein LMJF_34_0660 [Leishmania major strain Friedlin]